MSSPKEKPITEKEGQIVKGMCPCKMAQKRKIIDRSQKRGELGYNTTILGSYQSTSQKGGNNACLSHQKRPVREEKALQKRFGSCEVHTTKGAQGIVKSNENKRMI